MTPRRGQQGFVLIATLWVLAIATIVALSFGRRAFLDVRAARYDLEQTQARMAARGAVQRGVIEIRNKFYKDLLRKEKDDKRVGTHLGQPWARTRNLLGPEMYDWGPDFDRDIVVYKIEDADRYINVNIAKEEIIENIPNLSRSVKRRLKARREEEVHEGDGVARFQAIEELRYVRGMDDEEWFGEDDEVGVRELLSVYGGPRINLNTADRAVLEAIPELGEAAIEEIFAYRGVPQRRWRWATPARIQQHRRHPGAHQHQRRCPPGHQGVLLVQLELLYHYRSGHAPRGKGTRRESPPVVSFREGFLQVVDWQERAFGA